MWNIKIKVNEQAEEKQAHIQRKHFDGCQMGRGIGEMDEKGKGK